MNYQTVGLLFVLGALVYLWLTTVRLRQTVRALEQNSRRLAAAQPAVSHPELAPPAAIDQRIIAMVAAAVATVIKRPHRIIAVHADSEAQRAWSAEGRREIYLSHKIR